MEESEINNLDIEVHLLDDVSSCGHSWQQRYWFCLLAWFLRSWPFSVPSLWRAYSRLEQIWAKWSVRTGANGRVLNKWSRQMVETCAHGLSLDCGRHTRELNILGTLALSLGFEKCCPNGLGQAEKQGRRRPCDWGPNTRFT